MPTVSVVMPVYNGERFIEQAVGSLLAQSFTDLEIIAVDDGSTDDSLGLLNRMARIDSRLKVRSQPPSGKPAVARNQGLAIASGEFIGFLDCDDYSHPQRLERMVEGLKAHQEWVAAFHDLDVVDAIGNPRRESYLGIYRFKERSADYMREADGGWFSCGSNFYEFMCLNMDGLHTQSVLIARHRLGGMDLRFDTSFTVAEDSDLWFRLSRVGRFGYLDEILGSRRLHDNNITKKALIVARDRVSFHTKNYEVATTCLDQKKLQEYRTVIAPMHAIFAYALYLDHSYDEAYDQYSRAIALSPRFSYLVGRLKTRFPPTFVEWLRKMRG